jgi:hypothetical protein
MIEKQTADRIASATQAFWAKESRSDVFRNMAQGKEIGHRIADFIDEQTTALLARTFVTKQQRDRKGAAVARSMGDIWLESNHVYHPINVKAGVSGREGQPNMVSLKKLLDALVDYRIDSYYLLMVKVEEGARVAASVFFVDMLDYLDYVTFDSGPGQIMLRAKSFFNAFAEGIIPPPRSIAGKVDRLMDLLEDGERRLIKNRAKSLASFRERVKAYRQGTPGLVTPASQEPLNLQ